MASNNEQKLSKFHNVFLENRDKITLTGVTDIGTFCEKTINLVTDLGAMTIVGENLKVGLIDVGTGDFAAEGKVNSIAYSVKKPRKITRLSRLFK